MPSASIEARTEGRVEERNRNTTGSNLSPGATLAEIAEATDWENHSIRGFVSGHITKKMGLKVESTKSEMGERPYRIFA